MFWLLIWQILSMWIGQEILMVSPVATGKRLIQLLPKVYFWNTVLCSVERIMGGFLLGALAGTTYGCTGIPVQKDRRTVLSHGMCDEIHTGGVCDYPAVNVDVFQKSVRWHCVPDDISHPLYECTGRTATDEPEAGRAGRSI